MGTMPPRTAAEPDTRFKGGPQVAVIRERGKDQARFSSTVRVRPGDRIRLEVALDREQAILGGVLADDAQWLDLGDRASYLAAHAAGRTGGFPQYRPWRATETAAVHSGAQVDASAVVDADSSVGPGAVVEAGAEVHRSVIWPGARVAAGSRLTGCVVRSGMTASGVLTDADV